MGFELDIKSFAGYMLLLRLVSVFFLILVLRIQLRLIKLPATKRIRQTRYALLALTLVIMAGNLLPIAVDFATIFLELKRSSRFINLVSTIYSLDHSLTAMFSSIAYWSVYKLAQIASRDGESLR